MKNAEFSVLDVEKLNDAQKAAYDKDVADIKDACKTSDGKVRDTYSIGNNGYAIGQQFTFTGKVALNDYEVNGHTGKTPQCETESGTWISLKAIMGLSSPRGYKFDGTLKDVTKVGSKREDKQVELDCDITPEEYIDTVWAVPTRDLFQLYATLRADENILKGKVATYHGIIGREAIAKNNNNNHVKDEPFAITSRVWGID